MKEISFTVLLLLLCSCADTEKLPAVIEKNTVKKGDRTRSIKINHKKNVVHPVVRPKIGIIEEEHVPENVENIAKGNLSPISDFDRIAMQMVGKYVPEEFVNDRIYYGYLKFLDREWAKLCRNSVGLIPEWAINNIFSKIKSTDTLFYPLGGPDITYALSFFPNASEYILVGLEPVGKFSEIENALKKSANFEQIRRSLMTYLRGGYFITSEMGTTLSHPFLRGTLYLILLQLSAFDFEISNVEDLSIDAAGNEVARGHNMIDGVKITCRKRGEDKWRQVYYIRADLSDRNTAVVNLFNFMKKRTFHTFLKSASYALWDRTLSNARKFILDNSRFILQDDTGVPFASFDNKWIKYAFGTYTEPTLGYFRTGYNQPNMAKFFENNLHAIIPFKIGYGFYQARPNLLLAIPKDSPYSAENIIEEVEQIKEQYKNAEKCENCGENNVVSDDNKATPAEIPDGFLQANDGDQPENKTSSE